MAYNQEEHFDAQESELLKAHYKEIIGLIGEDPEREGLLKTPERMAESMQYLTHGYQLDAAAILNEAKFKEMLQKRYSLAGNSLKGMDDYMGVKHC